MEPIVLFGIQFTLSLVAYSLIAFWYVAPRLSRLPMELALVPLLWVHAFRTVGGTILGPGAVAAGVPTEFRTMIGFGDLITALLALIALAALRTRPPRCPRLRLAVRHRRHARHVECDRPIGAFQRLYVRSRRELGDRDHLCAGVTGDQPSDLHATARPQSLHHEGLEGL